MIIRSSALPPAGSHKWQLQFHAFVLPTLTVALRAVAGAFHLFFPLSIFICFRNLRIPRQGWWYECFVVDDSVVLFFRSVYIIVVVECGMRIYVLSFECNSLWKNTRFEKRSCYTDKVLCVLWLPIFLVFIIV